MAAESVGLAASVAGLLSLGLQVTEGIVKYVDAFDCRQEDLAWAKLRNDSLRTNYLAGHRSIITKSSQSTSGSLQQANDLLELTLTGFNLEISNCNKERLSAIEQSARLQAAEIQILRSQAAATRQPVLRMENQLSALQTHTSDDQKKWYNLNCSSSRKSSGPSRSFWKDFNLMEDK
ncbi:hypothetical protein CGGC5_v015384 [Colletotrichum fructicola Nara gc5]|uniref:Fungal N-terminal domain-containing protein n=1 Tax=Colletotrichum fructicola (strain Nara gc5) TaxID=1213859 RepID=A0A7J6IHQ9_COLFN|nr:hypothetical protein CGGC5_v015384 [Colletotrichum fructicola Nara gc5]